MFEIRFYISLLRFTYFIKRINVPSDPLGLEQLLSIIAPNSMVRNELRGLIGWMASLGSKSVQERLIQLDPYAVLANGDPSQLVHSSKVSLLTRLKEVEAEDPYFRRGDFWRKFNVSGFFTKHRMVHARYPICHYDRYRNTFLLSRHCQGI